MRQHTTAPGGQALQRPSDVLQPPESRVYEKKLLDQQNAEHKTAPVMASRASSSHPGQLEFERENVQD